MWRIVLGYTKPVDMSAPINQFPFDKLVKKSAHEIQDIVGRCLQGNTVYLNVFFLPEESL